MAANRVHIIAFDIPYPPDYGGAMDVFYKIKALKEAGFDITLHCFQYGERVPQKTLESCCSKVFYYKRIMSPLRFLNPQPFIVRSRAVKTLLKNLLADDAPILFEGLHTCAFIGDKQLRGRLKIVRMHNVEWEYYHNLYLLETRLFKKFYYKTESEKLKKYEKAVVKYADTVITISPADQNYFQQTYDLPDDRCHFIPPFHPNTQVECPLGRGDYVLFHGKLSVADNERAAMYLINKVFSKRDIPFTIAGKQPSQALQDLASHYEHITVVANPDEHAMIKLIRNAQINLLVSFQRSGMKLKLLNALYRGRFCVVNAHLVQNTGLESLCIIKNTSKDIGATIESLMNVQFSRQQIEQRRQLLQQGFSNKENALRIVDLLRG